MKYIYLATCSGTSKKCFCVTWMNQKCLITIIKRSFKLPELKPTSCPIAVQNRIWGVIFKPVTISRTSFCKPFCFKQIIPTSPRSTQRSYLLKQNRHLNALRINIVSFLDWSKRDVESLTTKQNEICHLNCLYMIKILKIKFLKEITFRMTNQSVREQIKCTLQIASRKTSLVNRTCYYYMPQT